MFAGHTDVVPPGDEAAWTHPALRRRDRRWPALRARRGRHEGRHRLLRGRRGAARRRRARPNGSISLLITGDEEGPSINGTPKLLDWAPRAARHGTRRSSASRPIPSARRHDQDRPARHAFGRSSCRGRQGHVAYPHLADNPVRGLMTLLDALLDPPFDEGTDEFQPTNLEITTVDVGNPAVNVIPERRALLQPALQRQLDAPTR
jgi:succinyl-diaminopimelate desuccinylase